MVVFPSPARASIFRYMFYAVNILPTADREMCNDITQARGAGKYRLHPSVLTL